MLNETFSVICSHCVEKQEQKNNAIIIARRPFLECCFVVVTS